MGGKKTLQCLVLTSRIHCIWLWITYPIIFYCVRNEELHSTVKLQLESPKETTRQAQAGNHIPTLCMKPKQPRDPLVSEWHSANRAFPSEIALRSLRDKGLLSEDHMLRVIAVEAEKHLWDIPGSWEINLLQGLWSNWNDACSYYCLEEEQG